MDLVFLLFMLLLRQQAGALKLLHIKVPPYTFKGDSALLQCKYDLGLNKLYSVTWYKDHEEFYRYVPKSNPNQHSYTIDGVKVDHHSSDHQQVTLRNVILKTSGVYRCEVSAEAPSFTSVHGEAHMEVLSLPHEGPFITGEEKTYNHGDVLALNCTSGKSFPPAQLKWFINGVQVTPDYEAMIQTHGLVSSVSSLRLEVGPDHLTDGQITVRCEATVQSNRHISEPLVNLRKTQVFVQGNAGLATPCSLLLAISLLHRLLLIA